MPSESAVPGRAYEIRDTDPETVLAGGVTGQELLGAAIAAEGVRAGEPALPR